MNGAVAQPMLLLLEDEAVNRALLRAALRRTSDPLLQAARLVETTTISEARSALARERVDVALLDVRLPDGSGLDLAREIVARADPHRPRVVVVSASVLPPQRDAALEARCDALVSKPYRPADLVETVSQLLPDKVAARTNAGA